MHLCKMKPYSGSSAVNEVLSSRGGEKYTVCKYDMHTAVRLQRRLHIPCYAPAQTEHHQAFDKHGNCWAS